MSSEERFRDDLIGQLIRTAIVLRLESSFTPASSEMAAESEILGSITARYFKNKGRRIAEMAYSALDAAGLVVEALAFSELWRRSHPEQDDLWETEDDCLDGNHNGK